MRRILAVSVKRETLSRKKALNKNVLARMRGEHAEQYSHNFKAFSSKKNVWYFNSGYKVRSTEVFLSHIVHVLLGFLCSRIIGILSAQCTEVFLFVSSLFQTMNSGVID